MIAAIGQWENLVAFSKHYLRAGASGMAKRALDSFLVHSASPENVGSSDVPPTHREPAPQVTRGGSGTEQECTGLERDITRRVGDEDNRSAHAILSMREFCLWCTGVAAC